MRAAAAGGAVGAVPAGAVGAAVGGGGGRARADAGDWGEDLGYVGMERDVEELGRWPAVEG